MNYYNEKMFYLIENVVWDDNFKWLLKVYIKFRSLIEVNLYFICIKYWFCEYIVI